MKQFDQEIKDKINSKTYDYKPSAWRAFKQHNNIPMLSTGAKLGIGAGIVAAFIGAALYFTLPSSQENKAAKELISQEQNTENQKIDTIENTPIVEIEPTVIEANAASHPVDQSHQTLTKTQAQSQISSEAPAQAQTQTQTQKPARIQPTYKIRPLEILVDTISSNDFPDYEVKPADMLP